MMKKVKIVFYVSVLILIVAYFMSPYKYQPTLGYDAIKSDVFIKAPKEKVFAYLGNSKNATDWSVYVTHITPLNSNEFKDGTVGSLRRCFTRIDEKSNTWDEQIEEVIPNQKRRLTCFNFKEFYIYVDSIGTEQLYADEHNGTHLYFTLFANKRELNWMEKLKLKYGGYYAANVFKRNLNNIKRLNE